MTKVSAHEVSTQTEDQRRADIALLRERIATELQDAFRQSLTRVGFKPQGTDPVIAALFHAFANRIAPLYKAAERELPEALLDELLAGLNLPARLPQPAQTVLRFDAIDSRCRVSRSMRFPASMRKVDFVVDYEVEVAPVHLAVAALVEPEPSGGGSLLRFLQCDFSESEKSLKTEVADGEHRAAVYLAFRGNGKPPDLSNVAMFIDGGPPHGPMSKALRRSPWQVLREEAGTGVVSERQIMVPRDGSGGAVQLEWSPSAAAQLRSGDAPAAAVDNCWRSSPGPYSHQQWLLPPSPHGGWPISSPPSGLARTLAREFPEPTAKLIADPCVWIRIPLDLSIAGAAYAVRDIMINSVVASNVERESEQLSFEERGRAISFDRRWDRPIVDIESVRGEHSGLYTRLGEASHHVTGGLYDLQRHVLELTPGTSAEGKTDGYAVVDWLVCDGERANGIRPRDVRRGRVSFPRNARVQVINERPSLGWSPMPDAESAGPLFAELLRTRTRIVTASDVDVAVRAYDARIRAVRVDAPFAERASDGLRRVVPVLIDVDSSRFIDPTQEVPGLLRALEWHLQQRAMIGDVFRVSPHEH